MLGTLVPKSFRQTVSLLVWAAVTVPLVILCVFQARSDYQRQTVAYERELTYETERFSFSLTQNLLQLMGELDRIASDGAVIRSLSMPILSPISVQKIETYLGNHPYANSVMLIDKEFFPIEVLPTWALTADISAYEPYMAEVVSSPESISDPRPRMFIPPVKEGQTRQLIFIRPILTASNSLSQPFQVDGLLLVEINIEKLIQAIIAKHPGDYALVRLLNKDQILYQQPPAEPGKLARHQTNILLGLGNQSLILEVGRPVEGIFAGIVVAYRTQVIVMFLFIVLMLVVIKKLADKLVRPLQLLSEVTTSMSNHNFQQRSAIVVDPKQIHYREFSEVFELLRDMEHIINEQFQQLHEANANLEEKVTERTEALKNNIQLLDWQRGALQQLVQYAMQVHQGCALNELGALSHELAERIAQQACGLYLLRSELFAGYEYWSGLSAAHKLLLQQNQAQLNDHSSLLALMQNNPGLQLFPVGGSGDGY